MKDLLRTADLTHEDMIRLLELAEQFKQDPGIHRDALGGGIVVLHFATPSTGTRLLFEAAVARLGGAAAVVGPDELRLGLDEPIEETARVISRYADAMVIRTDAHEDICAIARSVSIPVVNALTDGHHPCQSLADLLTIRERLHHFVGRKLAYVGRSSSVAHSLVEAAAVVGMDISVATPNGDELSPDVVERAELLAGVSGAGIDVGNDPHLAVKDADVVYGDVWLAVGDSASRPLQPSEALAPFRATDRLVAEAAPAALVMQCLPAHGGGAVDGVATERSVVCDQAENRLPTAQALLYALVNHELKGSDSR